MKEQKGITLIALVITIIVMLILVAVSVTIALNGGLFSQAKQAAKDTNGAINNEQNLADEQVNINNTVYNNFNEFVQAN